MLNCYITSIYRYRVGIKIFYISFSVQNPLKPAFARVYSLATTLTYSEPLALGHSARHTHAHTCARALIHPHEGERACTVHINIINVSTK